MENLSMCRICMIANVRMYHLVNTNLQAMYEKLTDMPFQTKDCRPLQVCYICCAKLRNCYQLQSICRNSEQMFSRALAQNVLNHRSLLQNCNTLKEKHLEIYLSSGPEGARNLNDINTNCGFKKQPIGLGYEVQVKAELLEAIEDNVKQEINILPTNTNTVDINRRTEDDIFDCNIQKFKVETHDSETDFNTGSEFEPEYSVQATELSDETYHKTVEEIRRENCLKSKATSNSMKIREICPKSIKIVLHKLPLGIIKSDIPGRKLLITSQLKVNPQDLSTTPTTVLNYKKDKNSFKIILPICKVSPNKEITTKSSEKKYKCETCNKCYGKSSILSRHSRIHSGIKGYTCDICKKSFVDRSDLIKHFRTHTGTRPFKCNECARTFNDRYTLSQHKRTHTGEKLFKCDICDKYFTTKSHLTRHAMIHTGEKPFKCVTCGRGFNQKGDLFKHIRVHTGEKPYNCNICKKCFTSKGYLSFHIRNVHSKEKPFKCGKCDKSFSNRCSLSRHVLLHTSPGENTKNT